MKALLAVYDKTDLDYIGRELHDLGYELLATGGTFKRLQESGIPVSSVSDFTGHMELLGGRVKTLHPKIHAGILNRRDNHQDADEMSNAGYESIDIVICNLYPFQETVSANKNILIDEAVEQIDIGGPTMLRASAKNFKYVLSISNPKFYKQVIDELKNAKNKIDNISFDFKKKLAQETFLHTAQYDSLVSEFFENKENVFPDKKVITLNKVQDLRYGENPHQQGSIYVSDYNDKDLGFYQIHGKELSYNNYNDMFASLEILDSLKKNSGTVIIKHANPCGVSENKVPLNSFKNAYASDPISAFGGVIACNYKIKKKIASEINKNFLEVILAKGFDKESLEIFKKKKNLRVIDISNFKLKNITSIKSFDGSFLIQSKDTIILDKKKLKCVTKLKPNKKELAEIQFAYNICKYVKSNAVVLCNNFSTIGIGAGQPSRLDSCKIAVQKAKKFQSSKIRNSIAASDAFFPFADGIHTLIKAGVKTIVQPGGSIRDQEIINAANKAKIKMFFTGIRHFNH